MPRVIPNPFDNTLLIQATPQDYEQITNLIEQLDVPPRQILVEAKIYEVNMSGDFSSGIEAFLRRRTGADRGYRGSLSSSDGSPALRIDAGFLVGQSRELLAAVTAAESSGRAKLVSAPSLIATDSVPATIAVGDEVPTLAAQAVSGVQTEGSSLFTQAVVNRQSGVTLNVNARGNPSGIVTLVIDQDVSAPLPPDAGAAIQSPSFSRRAVNTQVTVEDGDTIAIGGIISETSTFSSSGIPVLHRVPILGGLFGAKTFTKQRTELVIFMTPRVIHDTSMMREASHELRSKFKKLRDVEPD
jgi:general secretion pathway protein D